MCLFSFLLTCSKISSVSNQIESKFQRPTTHTKKITQNEVFCWFEKHPICKYQPTASCSKAFLCMAKAVYIRWELTAKSNCHYKLLSLRRVLTFSFLLSYFILLLLWQYNRIFSSNRDISHSTAERFNLCQTQSIETRYRKTFKKVTRKAETIVSHVTNSVQQLSLNNFHLFFS